MAALLCGLSLLWAQTNPQQRGVVSEGASSVLSERKSGNYYALIIGIDDYQHEPQLQTPINDAKDVAAVLHDQYGFKTQLLPDATRDQIVEALDYYSRSLNENDSLLIYYAGHGFYDKARDQAYWAPVDAGKESYARWIIATEITSTIKAIPARHVLVISDSCYSGMLTRDVSRAAIGPEERSVYLEKVLQKTSRYVMSSGGDEPVADGGCPGHSVFACVLLRDLQQFPSKEFTAEELFVHVKESVGGRSRQTPTYNPIRDSGHDGGDFVFFRAGAGPPESASLPSPSPMAPVSGMTGGGGTPPLPPPKADTDAITAALDNYEEAWASRDIKVLKRVWPSMSREQERAIKEGWNAPGLQAVRIQLRNRTIEPSGNTAVVTTDQWSIYTWRGTQQPPQTNSVEILLAKGAQGEWLVSDVKSKGR